MQKAVGKSRDPPVLQEESQELRSKSEEVGRMLNHMVKNPEKYRPK